MWPKEATCQGSGICASDAGTKGGAFSKPRSLSGRQFLLLTIKEDDDVEKEEKTSR